MYIASRRIAAHKTGSAARIPDEQNGTLHGHFVWPV
ncbi:hypothetical protein P3T24_001465 [Paraburkholderia sp. GAS33]